MLKKQLWNGTFNIFWLVVFYTINRGYQILWFETIYICSALLHITFQSFAHFFETQLQQTFVLWLEQGMN